MDHSKRDSVARPAPSPTESPIAAPVSPSLRRVTDGEAGIRRRRSGRGFRYLAPSGDTIRDADELGRIRALAVPPAWTSVWICADANGHLQATGRDARGRKQYRYHPLWSKHRDDSKFDRVIAFGEALPAIREQVDRDLRRHGLPRAKVLAAAVRLLELTLIRVGNEEYARANRSYGLTTLRTRHVTITGTTITFRFKGKSGVKHTIEVRDRRLARLVQACQALPGRLLFQYLDADSRPHPITSADVNGYLKAVAGGDFTAKDFRTWSATVLAATSLCCVPEFGSETEARRNVVAAIIRVAQRLGNTVSICRKSYVHPAVVQAYREGRLRLLTAQTGKDALASDTLELAAAEAAVLALLRGEVDRHVLERPA